LFLHIGADEVVRVGELVAIFDVRVQKTSRFTREFVTLADVEGRLSDVSGGSPKALVLSRDRLYISAVSSATLRRRALSVRRALEGPGRTRGRRRRRARADRGRRS